MLVTRAMKGESYLAFYMKFFLCVRRNSYVGDIAMCNKKLEKVAFGWKLEGMGWASLSRRQNMTKFEPAPGIKFVLFCNIAILMFIIKSLRLVLGDQVAFTHANLGYEQ